MNDLKKNFIYNICYQALILVLPLITVPYVSRVLGVDGIGVYSYTYAVVNYFMLVAMLGINNYGNRTIAKCRDNKELRSENFWSVYFIQLIMSAWMVLAYMGYLSLFDNQYGRIALIQAIHLLANGMDINWFFFGMEKFRLTVTRNMIIKIISLMFIFGLVKESSQIWLYTLILSGSALASQLLLWPFLLQEVCFCKINFRKIKRHILPIIKLFIPVIAISLYRVMDKIMLGGFAGVRQVGYYEQAEKIVNMPMGIITALGTVMLPRVSHMVSKGSLEEIKRYIQVSIKFIMFLAFPICFGIIGIAKDIVPLFLGEAFIPTASVLKLLSVTIIFLAFANVIRTQFLIPNDRDKDYMVSVIFGAVVNLILNLLLIKPYQAVGACIGTVAAEFAVMFYQAFRVRNDLPVKKYLMDILPFFFKAAGMVFVVCLVGKSIDTVWVRLLLQIGSGVVIYGILNTKYILSIIKP